MKATSLQQPHRRHRAAVMPTLSLVALVLCSPSMLLQVVDADGQACSVTSNDTCNMDEGEFCGNDDKCHTLSCQEYFDFGPNAFTGKTDAPSGADLTLECAPRNLTVASVRNAVYYGCKEAMDPDIDAPNTVTLQFNERCFVQVNDDVTYECFQMLESTSDDVVDDFITEANASSITCENEFNIQNAPVPRFYYTVFHADTEQKAGSDKIQKSTLATALVDDVLNQTTLLEQAIYSVRFDKVPDSAGPSVGLGAISKTSIVIASVAMSAGAFVLQSLLEL
uniref:Uncharacterized protein n=1 Tax=Craspedostauros australis TaxID=1486917 RepID=A0A6T6GLR8_9STRA